MHLILLVFRCAIVFVALFVLLTLSQSAWTQFQAEFEYQSAQLETGINRIQMGLNAQQQRPGVYDYQRLLARAYHGAGFQGQARDYYVLAIKSRPSWPYAWFDYADWLASNEEADSAQFTAALAMTLELGQHEETLLQGRARQAIELLGSPLPEQTEAILKNALEQQFLKQPYFIYGWAGLQEKEATVCKYLAGNPEITQWCKDIAYYRALCAEARAKTKAERSWCSDTYRMWESWI